MYKIYLGINDGEEGFLIPVLPESITFDEGGNNKTYEIINLGEVNTINLPKLTEISFESYFPLNYGPYVSVSSEQLFSPSFYIAKIREWREKKQKIRFIFVGSPLEINDLFTVENLKLVENGGEVGDIYYSIELKRYKKYAAKKVVIVNADDNTNKENYKNGETTVIKESETPRAEDKAEVKTHTVAPGDTLWGISKKYLGDGNRYMEIANLNGISNPDLIIDGQVLQIP